MKILIVDDEEAQCQLLQGFLEKQGYEAIYATNPKDALEIFKKEPVWLVLLDQRMPEMTGDELLVQMKKINPKARAIMITAYGAIDTAVKVMKLGADDFLEKPLNLEDLLSRIRRLEAETFTFKEAEEVIEAVEEGPLPVKIIAESPKMKEVLSLARRVAKTPWPVLIRGETGTGKELLARLIHLLSDRANGPFIEVNCAAIPETLFESELFGHEKGAFTGATQSKKGRFELAHKGSLFLDEIGEMPLSLQPKLLRTLQEGKIYRLGSEKEREVDVRVIAATNRDLKTLVQEGLFREDLYYRLNVFEIEIPPLRERREDIPKLIEFFTKKYALRPVEFSEEAIHMLLKYSYPGNVRELEHIIQRTVTLARTSLIRPEDLPKEVWQAKENKIGPLEERLAALERQMILEALEKTGWVQTRAAELLGISERVLRYKMAKHKIKRPDKKGGK
ncbi:sigma-54-dependent transcriptional regulator [Thermodesulfatator atlanticus]|uniref:sigma-54-dependent transcriptional regulator n=1 Tax=Thermodesulfatator atlanticus TaxID=501497 RepID=UPI0003B60F6D|nr:sigma-54 dependent transcriptional regulator [Thermodesulfatator atlanticus]